MKLFTLSFLFISLLFSCKKGLTEFEINGTLYTQSINEPVKNASIEVYKTTAGTTELEYISTYTTDENGNFNFKMTRDKFASLTLLITKDNHFSLNETIYFSDLSVEQANYFHYFTTTKGWAKIHLVSNSAGNNLNIAREDGKQDCEECCPGGFQSFSGAFDTTFYCVNDGGTLYSFNYFINNGSITGLKSAITPVGDTATLELIF